MFAVFSIAAFESAALLNLILHLGNAVFNTGKAEGNPVLPNVMILLATDSTSLVTKSQDCLTLSKYSLTTLL